ncbi:hypothetical protein NP233_g218 [Leucocoprinus birnbaumii]|uniref:Protein-S-isoprenylcysteine O-methyltransferase n=1 Tax=Leucocoprinus birnbaumii TaxID=56174 RepID=A0AAD5W2E0_9AGAR|nr:hypothetical protein NP233_g218 [Leucocoprinus birnbaumii]
MKLTVFPFTMLPIVKVPFILISIVGLQTAVTPPHPPPRQEEKARSTTLEVLLKQRSAPLIVKGFSWGIALAEVAVLVAKYAPDLPYSDVVLSNLTCPGGDAECIRFSPAFLVGAIMTTAGGFIRYQCYQALGSMFTFEMSIRKDHMLVTSGPYGVVRHPGYTGILLAVGLNMRQGSWVRESGVFQTAAMKALTLLTGGLVATITSGLMIRMPKEDEALHRLAGEEWEDWAKKVPYRLIPWVY